MKVFLWAGPITRAALALARYSNRPEFDTSLPRRPRLDLLGQQLVGQVLPVGQAAVIALAPGKHTAVGGVYAWGLGESGCLGHGQDLSHQLLPKKIEAWGLGQ